MYAFMVNTTGQSQNDTDIHNIQSDVRLSLLTVLYVQQSKWENTNCVSLPEAEDMLHINLFSTLTEGWPNKTN